MRQLDPGLRRDDAWCGIPTLWGEEPLFGGMTA